jgi:2-methylcitrate dehydratase PrpD
MCRSYDFEPTGPLVCGKITPAHLSGTTIPTALSVSEQTNASGKELLTALILGDDFASRIIAASNLNIDSGFESTGIANMFGATAIASRLWGLNEDMMMNALGIALNQLAGTYQNIFDGAHSFKLPQGLASRGGIFSVELARKGFTGVRDALMSKHGYFSLYCPSYQIEVLTKGLGTEFYADNTSKPYPCCRSNHAAIECALELARCNEIRPEDIEEVLVDVNPRTRDFAVGQPFRIREVAQIDAAFSLQYTVASTLLRKSIKLEHFTDHFIREPKVMDLVPKVWLAANLPPEKALAAAVKIKLRNGKEYEARVDIPRGHGTLAPLAPAEIEQKFFNNVAFSKSVSIEKTKRALRLLERLEQVDKITKIIEPLAA